jgi:hypothetical protein
MAPNSSQDDFEFQIGVILVQADVEYKRCEDRLTGILGVVEYALNMEIPPLGSEQLHDYQSNLKLLRREGAEARTQFEASYHEPAQKIAGMIASKTGGLIEALELFLHILGLRTSLLSLEL